jgi:hypothetical protein
MNKMFFRKHIALFAISIFIVMYGLITVVQPAFMFNDDGSLREFGVGYRSKTVFPAWLVSILISILSYLAVFVYSGGI